MGDRIALFPCRTSYFVPTRLEKRMILPIVLVHFILFTKSSWCKISARPGIEAIFPPSSSDDLCFLFYITPFSMALTQTIQFNLKKTIFSVIPTIQYAAPTTLVLSQTNSSTHHPRSVPNASPFFGLTVHQIYLGVDREFITKNLTYRQDKASYKDDIFFVIAEHQELQLKKGFDTRTTVGKLNLLGKFK